MSSYSTQLRTIIEQATQYVEGLTTRERIEEGRAKLFDFTYPIFDESYKAVFETNFIRHFYTREIGFETEGLFKFQLESWLLLNMPYYNALFESELIEFDPLMNSQANVTHEKTNDRTQLDTRNTSQDTNVSGTGQSISSGESDVTNNGTKGTTATETTDDFERDISSNMPDGRLALTTNDGQGVIEYASEIEERTRNNQKDATQNQTTTDTTNAVDSSQTDTTNNTTGTATQDDTYNSSVNDLETYVQQRVGKIGVQTYSKMLMEYRESFLRVEQQMFKEMQELFMLVY